MRPGHVYRRHRRRLRPAPHGVRGGRQRHRRGAGRLRHPGRRDDQRRRLGHRRRQRPRHPGRHPRGRGRLGGRGDHDRPARRREVQPELLQGLGRPARRRRVGGQRPVRLAGPAHLARRPRAPHALRRRRRAGGARWRWSARRTAGAAPRSPSCRRSRCSRRPSSPTRSSSTGCASWPSSTPACGSGCADHAARTRPRRRRCTTRAGVEAFVRYLDRSQAAAARRRSWSPRERDRIAVDVALQWNDGYHETMLCFTNNIPQRDGGTHLMGFRAALTRAINKYAEDSGIAEAGQGRAHRRGHARGPDLRPVGQDAGPEILLADQGQAGQLGGHAGGLQRDRRGLGALVRDAPGREPRRSWARWSRPRPRARRRAGRAS